MHNLLWDPAIESRLRERLAPLVARDGPIHIADCPASAEAWIIWELARLSGRPVLWISDGVRTLEWRARDFQTLTPPGGLPPLLFPSWEVLPTDKTPAPATSVTGARMECLAALASPGSRIMATCAQALMEATLSPEAFRHNSRRLATGQESDPSDLAAQLESCGYTFSAEVQLPGDAALRGGILDAWPLSSRHPLRLEFFGSTLESIRHFDPVEQHSIGTTTEAVLTPVSEWKLIRANPGNRASLIDHIQDENIIVVWSDQDSIQAHTDIYESTVQETKSSALIERLGAVEARLNARPGTLHAYVGSRPNPSMPSIDLEFQLIDPVPSVTSRHVLHPDVIESSRRRFLVNAAADSARGTRTGFFFDSEGPRERFDKVYGDIFKSSPPAMILAPLSGGFSNSSLGILVVAEPDLYGRKIQRRRLITRKAEPQATGSRVSDWTDMEPGNLVVHVEHGVGRYLGLREIMVGAQLQEALAIEYADGAKLYVPVAQSHLLTRYVGVGRRSVALHQLGGKRWGKEKVAAERAVQDLSISTTIGNTFLNCGIVKPTGASI